MPDHLPQQTVPSWIQVTPALAGALERASRAIARLDQALDGHPLLPAFLYRTRLEAVRRQAAVDGQLIDPWHLAAVLEGLRLSLDPWLESAGSIGPLTDLNLHSCGTVKPHGALELADPE